MATRDTKKCGKCNSTTPVLKLFKGKDKTDGKVKMVCESCYMNMLYGKSGYGSEKHV